MKAKNPPSHDFADNIECFISRANFSCRIFCIIWFMRNCSKFENMSMITCRRVSEIRVFPGEYGILLKNSPMAAYESYFQYSASVNRKSVFIPGIVLYIVI